MIRIDGFLMDVAIQEQITFPGEATSLPVETGPDVSDHLRDLPEEFSLECVVSNTPLGAIAEDDSRQGDGLNEPLPARDALQKLRDIKAAKRVVAIETNFGTFDSIAILEVEVTAGKSRGQFDVKDSATGEVVKSGGLFFTAKARRLHIISNTRVKIRVKTPMAGAGKGKTKVIAGRAIIVDHVILWRRGVTPGGPVTGLSVDEVLVDVVYERPPGSNPATTAAEQEARLDALDANEQVNASLTKTQIQAAGNFAPQISFIRYFYHDTDKEIVGADRIKLCADLQRDQAAQRQQAARVNSDAALLNGSGTTRLAPPDRNLPSGVSLDRFTQPTQETLPSETPRLSTDNLNAFSRTPQPTFPGG
jgi:hypothetical protein